MVIAIDHFFPLCIQVGARGHILLCHYEARLPENVLHCVLLSSLNPSLISFVSGQQPPFILPYIRLSDSPVILP